MRYKRLVAYTPNTAGVVVGYDAFPYAASAALNAEVAQLGGTWATSGATTDFTCDGAGDEQRSTSVVESGPRFAILGSTSFTDTQVDIKFNQADPPGSSFSAVRSVAVARYSSGTNYAFARATQAVGGILTFQIGVVVAGTETVIASAPASQLAGVNGWGGLRLLVRASGQITGYHLDSAGNIIDTLSGVHTALATGGTLASGKPGFADQSQTATGLARTRSYQAFATSTPPAEQLVINAGQSLTIGSHSNLRSSAAGVDADLPSRGSRLLIPAAGAAGRTTRIVVRAARNDVTTIADGPVGDSLSLAVFYTPRYLVVPRS